MVENTIGRLWSGKMTGREKDAALRHPSASQFTARSEESFYAVVDSPAFFQNDAQLIYRALRDTLKPVSFGDYLKRYIYRRAEISQSFDSVPLDGYLDIIVDSFSSSRVPNAFRPTSVRLRVTAKNWLTQQTVTREAVLLLGFGLKMSLDDVEELLTKGIQETRLNLRDPREAVCGYCYLHGLGYHKYENLMSICGEIRSGERKPVPKAWDPARAIQSVRDFADEEDLTAYVTGFLYAGADADSDSMAKRQFDTLYRQAQDVTADYLNANEKEDAAIRRKAAEDKALQADRNRIQNPDAALRPAHVWKADEITPRDIEQVLQAAIPRDRHGNLIPIRKSTLHEQLRDRRLSRQRLSELLSGSASVTRYDLIILQFFIFSQQKSDAEPKLEYYRRFVDQTNRLLDSCGMGPLYVANPFECFLMMCILSEDPLGTYADVIEQSYREAAE